VNETLKRKTEPLRVFDTIGQQLTFEEGRELFSWEVVQNYWDFLDGSDGPVHSHTFFEALKK
jgi:hypothetical protein